MKFQAMTRTLLLLAFLVLPGLGNAQETTWIVQPNRGWIGITIGYSTAVVAGNEQTVANIEVVEEDSPAQTAGILPGDAITRLDGKRLSQKVFTSLTQTLKVGDLLPITLLRAGKVEEVVVEAGNWPDREKIRIGPEFGEMVIRLDTVQRVILDELDQIRVRMGEMHLDSAPGRLTFSIVRRTPTEDEGEMTITYHQMFEPTFDSLAFYSRDFFFAPEFPMPFEALVVQSEAIHDLRTDQVRVRDELIDVRRLENVRRRELRATSPGLTQEALERDERVRELRARESELLEEQEVLMEQLRQVSEEEMVRRAAELQAQQESDWARARTAQEQSQERFEETLRAQEAAEAAFSYSRLMAAGGGLVAGAELKALNPELAKYFRVDRGILVLGVLEGTPAAEANLQGGDVIITVAGDSVSSLEDLKFGLAYFGRPLRLRVVRDGEPVEVIIRR